MSAVVVSYEKAYDGCWADDPSSMIDPSASVWSTSYAGGSASAAASNNIVPRTKETFSLHVSAAALRDECSVTNHVLHSLVPEVLKRPGDFSAEDLGYIADACSRFAVHPHGEGSLWTWSMLIAQRRQAKAGRGGGVQVHRHADAPPPAAAAAAADAAAGSTGSLEDVSMDEDQLREHHHAVAPPPPAVVAASVFAAGRVGAFFTTLFCSKTLTDDTSQYGPCINQSDTRE